MRCPWVAALWVLTACGPVSSDDDDSAALCEGSEGPQILPDVVQDGQPAGEDVTLRSSVVDPDGVNAVSLYYRTVGTPAFSFQFMEPTGDGGLYSGVIPGGAVRYPGVEWYLRATDQLVPCAGVSLSPAAAPGHAYRFGVAIEARPLPLREGFEAAPDGSLEDLGWSRYLERFPQQSQGWLLDDRQPHGGALSATHGEGVAGVWDCPPPQGDGTIERRNWLVSPALDLDGEGELALRWWERRVPGGVCAESHELRVSVGSPLPQDGDFQLVATPALPEAGWSPSPWYNLGAFAAADHLWVALVYQGGAAGRWQIDDLYVGPPTADLAITELAGLDSAEPGGDPVSLWVTLTNESEVPTGALALELVSEDSDVSVTGAQATLPPLAPGESANHGADPFVIVVGSAWPDDSRLPLRLHITDDRGSSWDLPLDALIGEPGGASVAYTALGDATLELELGYGSPGAPAWSVQTDSHELAGTDWWIDLVEQAAALPPGPGSRRWFLRAHNRGVDPATVDAWAIEAGQGSFASDGLPATIAGGEEVLWQLPRPPALRVVGWTSDPAPPAPGEELELSGLRLRNDGAATAGPLACVLGSASPLVDDFSTLPITFGGAALGEGQEAIADGSFSFRVDTAAVGNVSVPLRLLCTDGAETLTPSFDLLVPWASPELVELRVDDGCPACDGDGYPEAGEDLVIDVVTTNAGALATAGPLTLEVVTSGAPGFTVTALGAAQLGVLEPAQEAIAADLIEVSVDPDALLGDSLPLELRWSSGGDTWTQEARLELGGDWIPCDGEDPSGDMLGTEWQGAWLDLRGCSFRTDGELLQLRLGSWTPFDPATVYAAFFFQGALGLYTLESVGGTADLETSCVFGANVEPEELTFEPLVSVDDPWTVTARVGLADVGATAGSVAVAFGANSCPGTWFCDTWPAGALEFDLGSGSGNYSCNAAGFLPLAW